MPVATFRDCPQTVIEFAKTDLHLNVMARKSLEWHVGGHMPDWARSQKEVADGRARGLRDTRKREVAG